MTNYIPVKNLMISPTGEVLNGLRQVFPDKTGLFPAKNNNEYVTVEEIIEACSNDKVICDSLDAQIRHANITIEQLTIWREKFDKDDPTTRYYNE